MNWLKNSRSISLILLLLMLSLVACDTEFGVVILKPLNESQLTEGQEISVESLSVSKDKGLLRVELLVDDKLFASEPVPSSQKASAVVQQWKATPGRHKLSVIAYNSANVASNPQIIFVTVVPSSALANPPISPAVGGVSTTVTTTLPVNSGNPLPQSSSASVPVTGPQPIIITFHNPSGGVVGIGSVASDPAGGVKFSVQTRGLVSGKHGFHIHTVGKCEGPDFASAGGHFNPENKKHGSVNLEGPHAGDLPNLDVGADGSAAFEFTHKGVSLTTDSLLKADGSALVIHATEDDLKTDPTGNSGGRIACGVIGANLSTVTTTLPPVGGITTTVTTTLPTTTTVTNPAIPPGLYISSIQTDPPAPGSGSSIAFNVNFLNTMNNPADIFWRVRIFRVDNLRNSLGDTSIIASKVPVGTMQLKSGDWKSPKECLSLFAIVYLLDSAKSQQLGSALLGTNSSQFQFNFKNCN